MNFDVLNGDCRTLLGDLDERSVQCVVTSPPYFGLRDYGVAGQIGLEPTPDEFVAQLVAVFQGVRRVLKDDGTVWLNLGDSYYYDADAIKEPLAASSISRLSQNIAAQVGTTRANGGKRTNGNFKAVGDVEKGRNARTVWTVNTQPFSGAHFATMPEKLVEPCILAGSRPGDLVLDPFCGSGRVGLSALAHGRHFLGLELNPDYCLLAIDALTERAEKVA